MAPEAIEVTVELGSGDGDMVFTPDELTFERGKYYKLVITNPVKKSIISPRMPLPLVSLPARLRYRTRKAKHWLKSTGPLMTWN